MTLNLSAPDRKVRLVAAGVIVLLLIFGLVDGGLAWALGIAAVILAATSVVGFCPLYRAIGFSSLPRRRT